jgi:hypothetical protein
MNTVVRTAKGKIVATVRVDKVGRVYSEKKIEKDKHMLRHPVPSFAYDTFVMDQFKKLGVQYHVIQDKNTKQKWFAWQDSFVEHGFILDRGYGRQIALEIYEWSDKLS